MKKRWICFVLAIIFSATLMPYLTQSAFAAGETFKAVSPGMEHTMAIKTDGSLWGWGDNDCYLLGDGTDVSHYTPVKIMDGVASVSAGRYHTMAIKTDGSLWAWGGNPNLLVYATNPGNLLGTGTNYYLSAPLKIMDNVVSVSAGDFHTLAVKNDGSLWAWGQNDHGQLGDGTNTNRTTPVKIMDGVAAVSAGDNAFSLALKSDGSLWAWGYDWGGQLGVGDRTGDRYTPVKIMDGVVTMSAGTSHATAIKTDGSLWSWGMHQFYFINEDNSGGYDSNTPIKMMDDVIAVSAASGFTMAIKKDGSLWAWGNNDHGQLGIGVKEENRLNNIFKQYQESGYKMFPTQIVKVMDGVIAVSASDQANTFVIKNDGSLWVWGWNGAGQFGDGTREECLVPFKPLDGGPRPNVTPGDGSVKDDTSDYKELFDYYVDGAAKWGLIPSLSGSLDEFMTYNDLVDFMLQFSKVKSGIDVDSLLSHARTISSSEEMAKVNVINELMSQELFHVGTGDASGGEPDTKANLYDIFLVFSYISNNQIAPFSPLLYYQNNSLPIERYNFQNMQTVVYHMDAMGNLMSEIVGLSQGRRAVGISSEDYITRRQFAAFCYMFSTMSLPKDMSGKYPGGVSGDRDFDNFIGGILDSVIKPGMTDNQKIKAIYDYMIYNFKHDDKV